MIRRASVHDPRLMATASNQSNRPSGTGRVFYGAPGNKLPGYHHLVPTGQPSKEARKRLPQ
jgi:hypothetical protein